ncbi:MAG: FAD-dependent oxidoreductase [Clostridia bacterium]|nr:FAD-dependent oxidoreductase [Clostridia bacterium]
MKRTTAIILILSVMVVALAGALIYEISKDDWNIIVTPNDEHNKNEINIINKSGDSGEKNTQIEPDSVIIKDEVVENPTNDNIEVKEEYDLIVFSAEPEGIAAAIQAARSKMKVLLVEKRDGPGGLMTYGMLNTIDMNHGTEGELLNGGVFEEFYNKLGRNSFDVKEAKDIFQNMLDAESENLVQMYGVDKIEIRTTNLEKIDADLSNETSDLELEKEIQYIIIDGDKYKADNYIDCTQDADITAQAGAEYTIGWEDINEKNKSMSATLVIKMDGVDWDKMCKYIDDSKIPGTGHSAHGAWAFGEFTKQYIPEQTHMRLKALNIGKQNDGSVLLNSLQILNINTLDEEQKEAAYQKCVKEAENVAKFIAENVPGFENAYLSGVADELYVRETRHIIGEEKLTVKDILDSNYTSHAVAMGSYPLDVQTTSIYDWGYVIANPKQYYIPFGCIIPKGFTNLLTAGRCASYSSMAAGSARVIPTGMSLAEAAATAASISSQRNITFKEILNNSSYMKDLQQKIKLKGGYIDNKSKPVVDKNNQYYSLIIEMCEKGILSLGYGNEFKADEIISETDFILLVKTYLKRSFIREDLWNTDHINLLDVPDKAITPNRVKEIMYDITTYKVKDDETKQNIEDFLNIVVPSSTEELTTAKVYEILVGFKDYLIREGV